MKKVIKFYGNSCAQCKLLDAFLEGEGLVVDEAFSTDENPEKAFMHNLMGQPTLLLLDEEGKELHRMTGYNPGRTAEVLSIFESKTT